MRRILRPLFFVVLVASFTRYRAILEAPINDFLFRVQDLFDRSVHAASTEPPTGYRQALEIRNRFVEGQQRLVQVPDYLRRGETYKTDQVVGSSLEAKTLTIALGAKDGARVGAPVLFGDALIGVLTEVGENESSVRLISHPGFHTGAYVPQQDRHGQPIRFCAAGARGDEHRLKIRFMTVYDELREGEPVRAIPPDDDPAWSPRIGRLTRIRTSATGALGELKLIPHADLSSLLFVTVRCRDSMAPDRKAKSEWAPIGAGATTLPAPVIHSFDASPFRRSMLVGSGKDSGVRVGDAVLFSKALIGRIAEVGRRSSRVQLLGDPELRLVCTLASPDGTLTADSLASVRIQFLPAGVATTSRITVLDEEWRPPSPGVYLLLTAPGSGRISPGLPIAFAELEPDNATTLGYRLFGEPGWDEVEIVVRTEDEFQ